MRFPKWYAPKRRIMDRAYLSVLFLTPGIQNLLKIFPIFCISVFIIIMT